MQRPNLLEKGKRRRLATLPRRFLLSLSFTSLSLLCRSESPLTTTRKDLRPLPALPAPPDRRLSLTRNFPPIQQPPPPRFPPPPSALPKLQQPPQYPRNRLRASGPAYTSLTTRRRRQRRSGSETPTAATVLPRRGRRTVPRLGGSEWSGMRSRRGRRRTRRRGCSREGWSCLSMEVRRLIRFSIAEHEDACDREAGRRRSTSNRRDADSFLSSRPAFLQLRTPSSRVSTRTTRSLSSVRRDPERPLVPDVFIPFPSSSSKIDPASPRRDPAFPSPFLRSLRGSSCRLYTTSSSRRHLSREPCRRRSRSSSRRSRRLHRPIRRPLKS